MKPGNTKAVVLNMYYTGLGIARSLGPHGIDVIGLSAEHGIYGNSTRYAKVLLAPDSKADAAGLALFLKKLAGTLGPKPVLFPTRDHDVMFLDTYRAELEPHYHLVLPSAPVLHSCIDKWETYRCATRAGIAVPGTWLIEGTESLNAAIAGVSFPCVLKPLEAHHWRAGGNWAIVGGRKAIGVESAQQLKEEYARVSQADKRAVLQEMIPGGDDCLIAIGCYLDQKAKWAGGFALQKLVQTPAIFGTGCILRTVDQPELLNRTRTLLEGMGYTGVAEVEYKRDARTGDYKLIEVNPRPWDQHILGRMGGADVIHLAYCDRAGLPAPAPQPADWNYKWLAEDAFLIEAVRLAARRDRRFWHLLSMARGKRIHAICSWRDPRPFGSYLLRGLPRLLRDIVRAAVPALRFRTRPLPAHDEAEVI